MSISYIIPAYNSQDTLSKCLDSILRQPYDDYEVIIINDGSTDNTQQVIEQYQSLDSRVISLYQENSGQGAARSKGLSLATGDYIWFVDSDDWLLPSVLPRLSRILHQENPDVLLINFEFTFDNNESVPSSLVPTHLAGKIISPTESSETFAAVSCWNTPPWRLISRRKHLLEHEITFAKGVFYEDHPFAIHLMLTAKQVYIDPCITYGYYQRATSTTKTNDHKALDFLTIRKICLNIFKRFNSYETLAPIVASYILPVSFFTAHVPKSYQQEFIQRLHDDTPPEEILFAEKHGDFSIKIFAKAVLDRDAKVFHRALNTKMIRTKYSIKGASRFIKRMKRGVFKQVAGKLTWIKKSMLFFSRPTGYDASGLRFLKKGQGTRIEPIHIDVRVAVENRPYVTIGENSHIGGTYVFERGIGSVSIGNKSSVGSGCKFICTQENGIHIGNNVMISWDCTLMDSNAHSLDPNVRVNDAYDWKSGVDAGRMGAYKDWSQVESSPIYIEDNVWIGFESAVLKGVKIGKGSVIGARSMVTKDVAPYCVYAGSPARFIGYVPKERWSWEEIIHAAQGNPGMDKVLRDAYLHKDLIGSLQRYMVTDEFKHTLSEFKCTAPNAKSILDIGGAGGIMSIAFALSGYHVTLAEPSSDDIVGTAAARKLISLAAEKFDNSLPERMKIIQSSVEQLSLATQYDIVYCRQVVHHFKNPTEALKKIHGLLTETGVAFFVREHVVFDDLDLERFLQSHPFQQYTHGENAYRNEQYLEFIKNANMSLIKSLKFSESPINYHPHSETTISKLDEHQISGRPYTYITQKRKL